jgi:RimJ/RimL family protein N-acetyltransferase
VGAAGEDAGQELRTEHLLLRRWRERDLAPFAELNADARVMEYFPAPLSRRESDAFVEYIERSFQREGFGLWALELPGEASFIGFTGLNRVRDELPFAPAVEVGWRIAAPYWGRGLASEAARAAIACGFEEHGLEELVAYTSAGNERSRRVMERLNMNRDPREDFAHPALAADHRLAQHVLYRLAAVERRRG